jgi:hypothetical protein
MKKQLSPEALRKRLRKCEQEYGRIKARIRDVGFICEGSLVERWIPCGKPNCRCATGPDQWHGPYWQLSWKEAGTTVTRRLPPEHARLYQEWIANRRELQSILRQMQEVSRTACQHLLDGLGEPRAHRRRAAPRRGSGKPRPR